MEDVELIEKQKAIIEVTTSPHAFKKMSSIYQNDRDVVLTAIKKEFDLIAFASFKLRSNKEFIKEVMQFNTHIFNYITNDKNIKDDREVILAALQSNNLKYIEKGCDWLLSSSLLKNDKELIIEAIKNNGMILEKLNKEYRKDKNTLLLALTNAADAIKFVSKNFFDDNEVMLLMLSKSYGSEKNFELLNQISPRLKNDKKFLLEALKVNSSLFAIISEEFKMQRDVILAALLSPIKAIPIYDQQNCADGKEVLNDYNYYKEEEYYYILNHIDVCYLDDKEMVLCAVKANPQTLQFVSENFKNDKQIVLNAVRVDHSSLQYASKELKNDPEIALASVHSNYTSNTSNIKKAMVSGYVSNEIQELIGQQDPISVLEKLIFYNEMHNKIESKQETKKPKLKI